MTSRPEALPPLWQRLLALSGVAFAVLLVFGWFLSGGDAPNYTADAVVGAAAIATALVMIGAATVRVPTRIRW